MKLDEYDTYPTGIKEVELARLWMDYIDILLIEAVSKDFVEWLNGVISEHPRRQCLLSLVLVGSALSIRRGRPLHLTARYDPTRTIHDVYLAYPTRIATTRRFSRRPPADRLPPGRRGIDARICPC